MRFFQNNCVSTNRLEAESGVVLAVVAIAAFLLVLLSIGYSIDFPTTQASVIRAQSALDIGGANGLQTFYDYPAASNAAFVNADSVLRADYAASASGIFSAGFSNWNRNKHSVWIPTWNSASASGSLADFLGAFKNYRCESDAPGSCAPFAISELSTGEDSDSNLAGRIRGVLARVYDPGTGNARVNDFKNAITFYAHIRPYRYLPILPLAETEVVSTVRLKNTLTTIIVDPAFSMNDDNYQRVFGAQAGLSTGASDELMWPYAAFRRISGNNIIYPLSSNADSLSGWPVQSDYASFDGNLFKKNPKDGTAYVGADPNTVEKVFKFYTATCDSSPFFLFKAGVVNLLDRLTNSSAFNSTTQLLLTGFDHDPNRRLIPVYPANVQSGQLVSFDYSYPLPLNPGGTSEDHNRYLQLKKPAAFTGYIDSRNPDVTELPPLPSGFNRWDLAYCRGLYGSSDLNSPVANTTGFLLPEDRTSATEAELSHSPANKRRRNTSLEVNWVDDESVGTRDLDISMSAGQNDTGGESPRNMIGNLAMRVQNPQLEKLNGDLGSWTPPGNGPMSTGYRYFPDALSKACDNIGTAASNYNTPGTEYSSQRPIQQEAVVIYGFGLYSNEALASRNHDPIGNPGTEDQAFDDLRGALQGCLCGKPQRKLFLAMLPMDRLDRNQTVRAIDVVKTFSDSKMSKCAAREPAVDPCGGAGMGSIYTFVYDWEDDRFATLPSGTPTASVSPATPESDRDLRKLLAAQAFSEEVYDYITRLLIEYEYST